MIYRDILHRIYDKLVNADKIKDVEVDDTDKADTKVLAYNSTSGKLEYEEGGGSDDDAIHDNIASEITAITEKTALDGNDEFVIEDSDNSENKKSVKWSNVKKGEYRLGLGNYLYTSDDNSSFIFSDNNSRIYIWAGGGVAMTFQSTSYARVNRVCEFNKGLRQAPITTPSPVTDRAYQYGKDVSAKCELFGMDEDGNETQLTSHDEDGYYVHRSTVPKRNLKMEIQIEKMIREHYPEYITDKKLNCKQKRSFRYWFNKNNFRLTGLALIALIGYEVIKAYVLWW